MRDIRIELGMPVMSADGKTLGRVKEVRGDSFKVDAHWAFNYWLGHEVVEHTASGIVQLVVTRQAIGSAKLHGDIRSAA
ncbi:MAG TPA: DUF2171 domain-containing protein [Dehalococcoidia bacterium]|nr:DUF2171 domain-containing protein [Dehalococcoidia bacterium]